ncbi:lantibiotic dehydratase [Streptomyces sp. NPDC017056]|uniref:lantibiotic dehydratase n=1 Tax=Streptomyces sp. NPDC017056 TaxID=3364973 RepID=UPI00378C9828
MSGFQVADTFGVRIGGLPVSVLDGLRSTEVWRRIGALLDSERELTERGEKLSDALYELIGRDPAAKPALVALRRSVHNQRLPAARCWNDEVRAALPAELAADVKQWADLLAAHRQDLAWLDVLLTQDAPARHAALRQAAGHPVFRHGLIQGSPVLHEQLGKWLGRPEDSPPDRKLALRLAKYLSRVAAKTSPFSTFTISGLGRWDGPRTASRGLAVRDTVEINLWVVQQLVRQLREHPALAATARLRVNPSARPADGHWEFLGPGEEEPLRTLPMSAPVLACLDFVAVDGGRLRRDVVAHLEERSGAGPEQAARYVERLTDLGLLEVVAPFSEQAADPLAALREWVDTGGPALAEVSARLKEVATLLAGYPELTGPDDRARRNREIHRALDGLAAHLAPGRVTVPAKNHIIENALLVGPPAGQDRQEWEPVLRDLDTVRRCYAALDPALPGRVALARLFTDRFGTGAGVPFLAFHRAVQEELRADERLSGLLSVSQHGYAPLADSPLPRIKELLRIRDELTGAALDGQPDADGVVRVDPGRLSALADGWPEWLRAPGSVAFYGQVTGEHGGTDGFVVNAVNAGHGRGRDRIRRLLGQAGVTVAGEPVRSPKGVVLADTCRHYGSNVGLREPAVPDEIDYPGATGPRPAGRRIPLRDLEVRHDPGPDLLVLWSRTRDCQVRPVHPSLIAEFWLPPAMRLLIQAFGDTPTLLIPGRRMFGDIPPAAAHGVLREPRITIGTVTVSRRQWVFRTGDAPVRARGEADGRYLLRLASWLREHGVPDRCFVRALDPSSLTGGNVWQLKSRKPLYIDFANLLLVGLFERMLAEEGNLLFLQEALPDPATAPHYGDAGARVTEYLVEVGEHARH